MVTSSLSSITSCKVREDLPIVASDAVPVYLDSSTGKILVSTDVLSAAQKRRVAKKLGKEPEEVPEQMHICAQGESRQDKDRLTWICRQVLRGAFKKPAVNEQGEEVSAPRVQGAMLKSVIIVHCATTVWLDDIDDSVEPGVWKKDIAFEEKGRKVERRKGQTANDLQRRYRSVTGT